MKLLAIATIGALALLSACGPTPAEQAAMDAAQRAADQRKCDGFGFAAGSDGFAHCMMGLSSQRDAEAAADRRAQAARDAANQRAQAAQQAAKDQADRDAWDRKTGQGAYSSPSASPFGQNPVDNIQNQIESDIRRMQGD